MNSTKTIAPKATIVDAGATAARVRLVPGKERLDDLPELVADLPDRPAHRDLPIGGYVNTTGVRRRGRNPFAGRL